MSKYLPLRLVLESYPLDQEVTLRFFEIEKAVGGLPPSAFDTRQWWANTAGSHSQAKAWMDAGRLVKEVKFGDFVVFSNSNLGVSEKTTDPDALPKREKQQQEKKKAILDGVQALEKVVKSAGYSSTLEAVAAHTIFLHPETIAQTKGQPLFRIVRDPRRKGEFDFEKRIMFDDNTSPTLAFLWSSQTNKGPDIQFNHVWADSKDPDIYTALWNLCVTPAFLAKTTDGSNNPDVLTAIRYRSFELFGFYPAGLDRPIPPRGYEFLKWSETANSVGNLELILRERLKQNPKSSPALSAQKFGWLFSDWEIERTTDRK